MYIVVTKLVNPTKILSYAEFETENEGIDFLDGLDPVDFPDAFTCAKPIEGNTEDWVVDAIAKTTTYVFDRDVAIARVSDEISKAFSDRIVQGVTWQYNGGDTPHPVKITTNMRMFLDNTQAAINHLIHPRPNVHGGVLFQDGAQFAIDDTGIIELALFAYSWGLKISQKAQTFIADLPNKTDTQLKTYNIDAIDWSIVWDGPDQTNGWDNSNLTQTP